MSLLQNIDSPADLRRLRTDQLQIVADEIRTYILETMSRIGGHTGASLGAVELAVALHYAFDTPRDRLVWDVGHQAYAHKILTGRRDLLPTVKQYGGISGFLRRDESEYDTFGAGHASTSLSAALGMAIARDRKGEGYNVRALVAALREAQQVKDGPVIVHALTTKGKGHPAAESDYYKWHATGPFELKTGKPIKSAAKAPTYTQVFGETLCQLMEKDEKVVALTAAMPDGTGVCMALEKFPDRAFDVGIAEQHCVTFAAGMSCEGLKPVCAIYSTFLQRGYDQLVHDVC